MYADICADEIMVGINLFNIRYALIDFIFNGSASFCFAVVQVDVFLVAKPYYVVIVYEPVAHRSMQIFCLAFGEFVYQLETVMFAFVAENTSLFADFP